MKQELERVASLLSQEDPISERYEKLLAQYITIYRIYKETDFLEVNIADATKAVSTVTEPQKAEPAKKSSSKKKSTSATTPEDLQKPTTTDEPEPSAPITEYTVEYVRGLLSEVSRAGTPVQPLVKKYTPEDKPVKFSSIPAEKYPELVEELKTYAG